MIQLREYVDINWNTESTVQLINRLLEYFVWFFLDQGGQEADAVSVCSCTCYGTSGTAKYTKQNPEDKIHKRAWRRMTR